MSPSGPSGTNTLIDFGGGNTMTLNNVTMASLTANDFVFGIPISGDLGISVNKGGMVVLTTADFHAVDPNYTADHLTFTVSNPTHGHVACVGRSENLADRSVSPRPISKRAMFFSSTTAPTRTQATFKVSVSDGVTSSAVTTIIATVPTVTINVLTANGIDFQNGDPIKAMGAGTLQSEATTTPPTITIVNTSANLKFVFEGTGLTLDDATTPTDVTAGTITAIHAFTNDPTPVALFDITGSIDAATWYDAIVAAAAGNNSLIQTLTSGWSFSFTGGAGSDAWSAGDLNDFFHSSGGNDFLRRSIRLRPRQLHACDRSDQCPARRRHRSPAIASVGTDTLRSIEFVTGTNFNDTFNAIGFSKDSTNAGSTVTFNTAAR